MAVTEYFAGTQSVDGTEWSLTTDTSGPDVDATPGCYQLFLDLNALAAGDEFELKLYEKVQASDTQRVAGSWRFIGAQGIPNQVLPAMLLMNGWDFTLKKIAGTNRTITWSIRKA